MGVGSREALGLDLLGFVELGALPLLVSLWETSHQETFLLLTTGRKPLSTEFALRTDLISPSQGFELGTSGSNSKLIKTIPGPQGLPACATPLLRPRSPPHHALLLLTAAHALVVSHLRPFLQPESHPSKAFQTICCRGWLFKYINRQGYYKLARLWVKSPLLQSPFTASILKHWPRKGVTN